MEGMFFMRKKTLATFVIAGVIAWSAMRLPIVEAQDAGSTTPRLSAGSISADLFKPGQTLNTDSQRVTLELAGGSRVDVHEGAVFQQPKANEYYLAQGDFHLTLVAPWAGKMFSTPQASFSTNKAENTEIWVTVEANQTIIRVSAWPSVYVTANSVSNPKKTTKISGGQQVTISADGTIQRQSFAYEAIDHWYDQIPPSDQFKDKTWQKRAHIQRLSQECATTAGAATSFDTLTPEEQQELDGFNANVGKFKIVENTQIDQKTKKAMNSVEKSDSRGTHTAVYYLDGSKITYGTSFGGPWKTYTDAPTTASLLHELEQSNVISRFDKKYFHFSGWETGRSRAAHYDGVYSFDGARQFLLDLFGTDLEEGQELFFATIEVDGTSLDWSKITTNVNVVSGKLTFPVHQECTIYFDTPGALVHVPKGASVNLANGEKQLKSLFASIQ